MATAPPTMVSRDQWDISGVPPDAEHHHAPDGDAILLEITDRPVFKAFEFFAEASVWSRRYVHAIAPVRRFALPPSCFSRDLSGRIIPRGTPHV